MQRLSRLAPEEIAGTVLLVVVLAFVALRPGAITDLFESPYATPVPGGGPARERVAGPTATPASRIIQLMPPNGVRSIQIGTTEGRTNVYLPAAVPGSDRCPDMRWTSGSGEGLVLVCVPSATPSPRAP